MVSLTLSLQVTCRCLYATHLASSLVLLTMTLTEPNSQIRKFEGKKWNAKKTKKGMKKKFSEKCQLVTFY